MKVTKKLLSLLFIVTLLFGLCACSKNTDRPSEGHSQESVEESVPGEPTPTEEPGLTEEEKQAIAKEEYFSKAEQDFDNNKANIISYSVRTFDDSIAKDYFGVYGNLKNVATNTEKVTAVTVMIDEADMWSFAGIDVSSYDEEYWAQYGIETAYSSIGKIKYDNESYYLYFYLIPGEHALENMKAEFKRSSFSWYECEALNGEEIEFTWSDEEKITKKKDMSDKIAEIETLDYCEKNGSLYYEKYIRSGNDGKYVLTLDGVGEGYSSKTGAMVYLTYNIYGLDGQRVKTDIAEVQLRSNGVEIPDGIKGYGENNKNNTWKLCFEEEIEITHNTYSEDALIPSYTSPDVTILDEWYDAFSIVLVTSSGEEYEFDVEPVWSEKYNTEE